MTYIVVFLDRRSWKAHMTCIGANSEADARRGFRECYRHGDYQILSVCKMPENPQG